MSESFLLPDLVKNLPTVTDASGKNVLIADAQGALSIIAKALLTGITLKTTTAGAHIVSDKGIHIIFSYSKANVNKFLLSVYIRKDSSGDAGSATWFKVESNGLVLGAWNAHGTINVSGADDIVHQVLSIGFDMT